MCHANHTCMYAWGGALWWRTAGFVYTADLSRPYPWPPARHTCGQLFPPHPGFARNMPAVCGIMLVAGRAVILQFSLLHTRHGHALHFCCACSVRERCGQHPLYSCSPRVHAVLGAMCIATSAPHVKQTVCVCVASVYASSAALLPLCCWVLQSELSSGAPHRPASLYVM